MNRRQADGTTFAEQLVSVARQTGVRPASLDGPPLPADAAHVWDWFLDLQSARGGAMGPAPFTWSDLASWAWFTGNRPRRGEIEAIMMLDRLWLEVQAEAVAG